MTDHKGICVFCDMGYRIPSLYGEAMLKMPSNVYGVAVRRSPDIAMLRIERPKKALQSKQLSEINKTYEGHRIVHFLGNYPAGYLDDSLQPFNLIPQGEFSSLAAFLVGDFKKHLPTTEAVKHSPEFWCATNKLLPLVQRVWRLTKQDASAFNEELKTMEGEIKDLIGLQGGMITLMLATKDDTVIHQFQKSLPTFKKFQWGSTSDVLGYVTGVAEPTKDAKQETKNVKHKPALDIEVEEDDENTVVVVPKKASESKQETKNNTNSKPAETVKDVVVSHPITQKVTEKEVTLTSGAIVRRVEKDGKIVYMYWPPMLTTKNKALRKAYLTACGRQLSDEEIKSRVGVVLKNEHILKEVQKSFADLSVLDTAGSDAERLRPADTAKETVKVQDKATGKVTEVSVTEAKQDKPLPQGPSTHEDREKHPDSGSPIYSSISPVDKHFIVKHLDKNGMEILDPTKMQELEDTTKMFHEEFPLIFSSFEDTWKIKPEMRAFLNAKCPGAMAMWQGDLIRHCVNLTKQLEQLTDPDVVQTHYRGKKSVA